MHSVALCTALQLITTLQLITCTIYLYILQSHCKYYHFFSKKIEKIMAHCFKWAIIIRFIIILLFLYSLVMITTTWIPNLLLPEFLVLGNINKVMWKIWIFSSWKSIFSQTIFNKIDHFFLSKISIQSDLQKLTRQSWCHRR